MTTYCPHCGAMAQENDLFCPQCGGRLKELGNTALVPVPETVSSEVPADAPSEIPAQLPDEERASEGTDRLSPDLAQLVDVSQNGSLVCAPEVGPKKDRTLRWIIIGMVVTALVCCCCLTALFLLGTLTNSGGMSLIDLWRQSGLR
jgi:hypothetical protein